MSGGAGGGCRREDEVARRGVRRPEWRSVTLCGGGGEARVQEGPTAKEGRLHCSASSFSERAHQSGVVAA